MIPRGMGDSRTDDGTGTGIEANAETAALREQLTLAHDRLAERDRQLAELDQQIAQRDQQLAEQVRQLAELREKITLLFERIRKLEKLSKRLRMKPSGMASSEDEDTDNSASGSSGSGRSGKAGKDRRKGRGPRRRNRHLHRRDVTVGLDDVPKGAVHKGYQDHTVRDIVFHARGGHLPMRGLGVSGRLPTCGAASTGGGDGTRTVWSRRQGFGHHAVLPVPVDNRADRVDAERRGPGHLRASASMFGVNGSLAQGAMFLGLITMG